MDLSEVLRKHDWALAKLYPILTWEKIEHSAGAAAVYTIIFWLIGSTKATALTTWGLILSLFALLDVALPYAKPEFGAGDASDFYSLFREINGYFGKGAKTLDDLQEKVKVAYLLVFLFLAFIGRINNAVLGWLLVTSIHGFGYYYKSRGGSSASDSFGPSRPSMTPSMSPSLSPSATSPVSPSSPGLETDSKPDKKDSLESGFTSPGDGVGSAKSND